MVSKKERTRELVNASGMMVIAYMAAVVLFFIGATPDTVGEFGWFVLIGGVLFTFLGVKVIQVRRGL